MQGHFELNVFVPADRAQPARLDPAARRRRPPVRREVRRRHRGEPRERGALRRADALSRDGAQPVHRLRQGHGDREGSRCHGPSAARGGARRRGRRARRSTRRWITARWRSRTATKALHFPPRLAQISLDIEHVDKNIYSTPRTGSPAAAALPEPAPGGKSSLENDRERSSILSGFERRCPRGAGCAFVAACLVVIGASAASKPHRAKSKFTKHDQALLAKKRAHGVARRSHCSSSPRVTRPPPVAEEAAEARRQSHLPPQPARLRPGAQCPYARRNLASQLAGHPGDQRRRSPFRCPDPRPDGAEQPDAAACAGCEHAAQQPLHADP